MGVPAQRARASLRLSLQKQTTDEEIDQALLLVTAQVARLRELSVDGNGYRKSVPAVAR
jgi:cysteine sulfinate desulfinase/cysteine desulfurase-like protein